MKSGFLQPVFPYILPLIRGCVRGKFAFQISFFKTKLIFSSSHGLYPFYNIATNNAYYFWLAPFAESQILKKKVSLYDKGLLCATHVMKISQGLQECWSKWEVKGHSS